MFKRLPSILALSALSFSANAYECGEGRYCFDPALIEANNQVSLHLLGVKPSWSIDGESLRYESLPGLSLQGSYQRAFYASLQFAYVDSSMGTSRAAIQSANAIGFELVTSRFFDFDLRVGKAFQPRWAWQVIPYGQIGSHSFKEEGGTLEHTQVGLGVMNQFHLEKAILSVDVGYAQMTDASIKVGDLREELGAESSLHAKLSVDVPFDDRFHFITTSGWRSFDYGFPFAKLETEEFSVSVGFGMSF